MGKILPFRPRAVVASVPPPTHPQTMALPARKAA